MFRRVIFRCSKATFSSRLHSRGVVQLSAARANEYANSWTAFYFGAAVIATASLVQNTECDGNIENKELELEKGDVISNWSATHTCSPTTQYAPKSAQEVCRVLERHHAMKAKVRPIGTALSPNGIGMHSGDVISVAALDYVEVDKDRQLVTVGAGATVAHVLAELGKYGLTLENFSSIQEQQIGGWTQVAAHGTGCTLPTVEEMVVRMKLATPTEGLLTLSETSNPRLFRMAKTGLGSLGVVTELTLRCIPKHDLMEYTFTLPSGAQLSARHYDRLQRFRHVRYMWFPYTHKTCVVVSNPIAARESRLDDESAKMQKELGIGKPPVKIVNRPAAALCELLLSLHPELDKKTVQAMTFAQLRDQLLGVAPLDTKLVKKINAAEAEFWERSEGYRADDSTNVLGFDCGGAQWVLEVCFPIGSLEQRSERDLEFVRKLKQLIEDNELPAPCPIEQRWTARSTSPMSPAYSSNPDDVFSWVGVIMYLPPTQSESQRQEITERFREYVRLMRPLCEEYSARVHWAKIEPPARDTAMQKEAFNGEVDALRQHIQKLYPALEEFNQYRDALDPHRILSNELIEILFGK